VLVKEKELETKSHGQGLMVIDTADDAQIFRRWKAIGVVSLIELFSQAIKCFLFSKDSEFLGDKKPLETELDDITGIPVSTLQGYPLSDFSVTERMRWIAKRHTKYEEDKVYMEDGQLVTMVVVRQSCPNISADSRSRTAAEGGRRRCMVTSCGQGWGKLNAH